MSTLSINKKYVAYSLPANEFGEFETRLSQKEFNLLSARSRLHGIDYEIDHKRLGTLGFIYRTEPTSGEFIVQVVRGPQSVGKTPLEKLMDELVSA